MSRRHINTTPKATIAVLFDMGPVRVTEEVRSLLPTKSISVAFGRHVSGDWGHMGWKDECANFVAARIGVGPIVSVFPEYGVHDLVIRTTRSPRPATTMALGARPKETG